MRSTEEDQKSATIPPLMAWMGSTCSNTPTPPTADSAPRACKQLKAPPHHAASGVWACRKPHALRGCAHGTLDSGWQAQVTRRHPCPAPLPRSPWACLVVELSMRLWHRVGRVLGFRHQKRSLLGDGEVEDQHEGRQPLGHVHHCKMPVRLQYPFRIVVGWHLRARRGWAGNHVTGRASTRPWSS